MVLIYSFTACKWLGAVSVTLPIHSKHSSMWSTGQLVQLVNIMLASSMYETRSLLSLLVELLTHSN